MKLLSCHIDNFGKLSNLTLDFSNELNIVHESNGWGKSTLANFLKVMFYGLDSQKVQGNMEREREIYRPWQGGIYGGQLDFEVDGRHFCVHRIFGKTEKMDEFHLYDLDANTECFDYSSNLGIELFDLDSQSFQRSIYIAQNDCESFATDAIHAKLGNLAENTNDVNNFESASNRLHDLLNNMSPIQPHGSIKKRKNLIEQISEEIRDLDFAGESYGSIRQELGELEQQRNELLFKRQYYVEELSNANQESVLKEKRRQYQELQLDLDEKMEICRSYEEIFYNGVPTEEELRRVTGMVRQIAETETTIRNFSLSREEEQKLQQLSEQFAKGIPDQQQLSQWQERQVDVGHKQDEIHRLEQRELYLNALNEEEKEEEKPIVPKKSSFGLLGILAIVASVLVLVVAFTFASSAGMEGSQAAKRGLVIAAWLVFLLGASAGGYMIYFGKKKNREYEFEAIARQRENENRKKERQRPLLDVRAQMGDIRRLLEKEESDIAMYLEQYDRKADQSNGIGVFYELSQAAETYERLSKKKEELERVMVRSAQLHQQFQEFASVYGFTFGEDIASELAEVQNISNQYRIARQLAEQTAWKIQQIEQEYALESTESGIAEEISFEQINEAIQIIDAQLEQNHARTEYCMRRLEDFQEQLDLREEKQQELQGVRMQQQEELSAYEIMRCTKEYLQEAKNQYTERYMEPISQSFGKYYDRLVKNNLDEWKIDTNIGFQIREEGELRDVQSLSAGGQDLIGFCMHLALVDVMYREEKPFLLLDDPFVNLDESKTESAMQLLTEVAAEYQIIYFTCHESRTPFADRLERFEQNRA